MSFNFLSWGSKRKTMLGITSRSHENNFRWLVEFIRKNFSNVFDVKYLPITNTNRYDWEEGVRACSAVILYHTKNQGRVNITDVDGSLYDEELCYLSQRLGKEKVMVLLDDMKDISENERQRILSDQPSLKHLALHLILIPERNKFGAANRELQELFYYLSKGERTYLKQEKSAYTHPTKSHQTSGPSSSSKNFNAIEYQKYSSSNASSSSPSGPSIPRPPLAHSPYRVGIFSRSARSNYTWLMDSLKADPRLQAAEINAFCISNRHESFRSGLQKCDFAILYHTKNQGRINITDVTDSLYDVELREMSQCLRKDNVIVVIDDMESSESEAKDRILERQFSINIYAKDLFLFTEKKKNMLNLDKIREIIETRCVRTSTWQQAEILKQNIQSWTSEKGTSVNGFFNNSPGEIWTNLRKNSTSAKSKQPPHPAYRVGIFSRSAHSNYTWLIDCLKADPRLKSAEINAFCITNNYQTFRSGLQQCHFTILYHTKKQGRINITDVTDSLYDEELQEMSRNVGKGNVIVVVDDLDSVEPEVKRRILANQPKIGSFARDLFLFTETNKHTMNVEEIRGIIRKSLAKFEEQFIVPDTQEHPKEVHRNGESSMTDAGSSVDSLDNRTAQDKETTSAASPFSSQSDSHQKSDTAEPQSKRSKTTSNEETDSMDVKDLMEPSPFYLIRVMRKKWENSQQEIEQLRQTIKQLKEENAHQKIIIQNLKENRSQEETIKKCKGKNLYQKENIKKNKNENTTVHLERETRKMFIEEERSHNMEESQENIEEKKGMILEDCADGQEEMKYEEASHEEEVQEEATGTKTSFPEKEEKAYKHRTRELERLPKKEGLQNPAGAMSPGDLTMTQLMTRLQEMIIDKGLKIQRQELVIQRLGDEIQRKGDEIQKQGEEIYKQGEEIERRREGIGWTGEEIQRSGEEIQRRGKEIGWKGKEIQRSGEEIQKIGEGIGWKGEEIQRSGEEIQRSGEGIGWKGEDIQIRGEEIRRKGEEIQRWGGEIQRRGEGTGWKGVDIQRRGEEIERQGEGIQRKGKEIQKRAEKIKRKGEEIKRKGEAIQRVEEEIVWQGEEIHRLGEEIQKQREEIQDLQKETERQMNELLSYELICNEILGENKWKVQ